MIPRELVAELPDDLRHDCTKCQSLCCVALKINWDGGCKPQGEVCEHLSEDHRCSAWDQLDEMGRADCRDWLCLGVGPEAVRPLVENGIDWRSIPEQYREILFEAFRRGFVARCADVTGNNAIEAD